MDSAIEPAADEIQIISMDRNGMDVDSLMIDSRFASILNSALPVH